jgi:hypothetical protein
MTIPALAARKMGADYAAAPSFLHCALHDYMIAVQMISAER